MGWEKKRKVIQAQLWKAIGKLLPCSITCAPFIPEK